MRLKLILLISTLNLLSLAIGERDWWQNGNFYQIYPRSFKDSDGDGIGDLNGVTEKLEYLKDIGMDGVWLSPIFKSPMADFGYDISDYYAIQDEYGTIEDLERLIEKAHKLGIRIILDFVPNHTSDEHEWFIKSVNGDPKYRDYYVWHDGIVNATTGKRQPPNNWICSFRYSAWEWNDKRQQFYLHQFAVRQPDLNYRNPAILEETKKIMNFWMEKGVDGFRIDAVPFLYEVEIDPKTGTYPDEPVIADVSACPNPNDWCHLQHIHTQEKLESIETVYDWRDVVDKWTREHNSDTKIILTEAYASFNTLMNLYGNGERNGSFVPFNFEMLQNLNNQSTVHDYLYYPQHWLDNMPEGVYANWVLGNHDNKRVASRFGPQRKDLINIYLNTLPGISVTYNGDEYGMEDVFVSWEETVDVQGCNAGPEKFDITTRDPARTPFLWDNTKNAGFSSAEKTWLPVGEVYKTDNVQAQLAAEKSHLKIFKKLIEIRQENAFQNGSFEPIILGDMLIYRRQADSGNTYIIVLNIGGGFGVVDLDEVFDGIGNEVKVVVSSLQSGTENGEIVDASDFVAQPYSGYVLQVNGF